jgi:hypothetical protein
MANVRFAIGVSLLTFRCVMPCNLGDRHTAAAATYESIANEIDKTAKRIADIDRATAERGRKFRRAPNLSCYQIPHQNLHHTPKNPTPNPSAGRLAECEIAA